MKRLISAALAVLLLASAGGTAGAEAMGAEAGIAAESVQPAVGPAVTRGPIPIRTNPNLEADIMLSLEAGTEVEVQKIETYSGVVWACSSVKLYDSNLSVTGWIKAEGLRFPEPKAAEEGTLALRSKPSADDDIVARLGADMNYDLIRVENVEGVDWACVCTADGNVVGWIEAARLGLSNAARTREVTTIFPTPELDPAEACAAMAVRSAAVHDTPTFQSREKAWLESGVELEALKQENVAGVPWVYVRAGEHTGWVEAENLVLFDRTGHREGVSETAAVIVDVLPLYSLPAAQSQPRTQLTAGARLVIQRMESVSGMRWAYVRLEAGTTGWVMADQMTGTVTADTLNVRSGPSTDDGVVTTYRRGTIVAITQIDDGWCRTKDGWISQNYVQQEQTASFVNAASLRTGVVDNPTLNIRSGPGSDSDFLAMYAAGDRITILETRDGWGRTDRGWVDLRYVKLDG